MPTLNEIYADLVKWGMPEHPTLSDHLRLLGGLGRPIEDCMKPQFLKDFEAILTQHALEWLERGPYDVTLETVYNDDCSHFWALTAKWLGGGGGRGLSGEGDTLILAIHAAAKQLGSEG